MSSLTAYSAAASYLHWFAAAPMIMSIGSVLKAQNSPKSEKGVWMHRHKSFGLLTGMIVAPRFGYRLFNAAKVRLPLIIYNSFTIRITWSNGNSLIFILDVTGKSID